MEKAYKKCEELKNKFKFSKVKEVLKDPKVISKHLTRTICHVTY